MKLTTTEFEGLIILRPTLFEDSRGYFYESYNFKVFNHHGINQEFVQDNQSKSKQGVIRGLHYQLAPYAQTKLVRVLQGEIFDVAVDLRKESPTFGKWYGIELSDHNNIQLLIPAGFAHGFSVISHEAIVMYKTDDYYRKEAERGIIYNDPMLEIAWKTGNGNEIVSERDRQLPLFNNAEMNFIQ